MTATITYARLAELIADYDDMAQSVADMTTDAGACLFDVTLALRELQRLRAPMVRGEARPDLLEGGKLRVPWGMWHWDGRESSWTANPALEASPQEQYDENMRNGHICVPQDPSIIRWPGTPERPADPYRHEPGDCAPGAG